MKSNVDEWRDTQEPFLERGYFRPKDKLGVVNDIGYHGVDLWLDLQVLGWEIEKPVCRLAIMAWHREIKTIGWPYGRRFTFS